MFKESHVQQAVEKMATVRENLTGRVDAQRIQEGEKKALEKVERIPSNVYLAGVLGSIALSAVLFVRGRRAWALFVGLWPPTILNLAVAIKQLRPSHEISTLRKAA